MWVCVCVFVCVSALDSLHAVNCGIVGQCLADRFVSNFSFSFHFARFAYVATRWVVHLLHSKNWSFRGFSLGCVYSAQRVQLANNRIVVSHGFHSLCLLSWGKFFLRRDGKKCMKNRREAGQGGHERRKKVEKQETQTQMQTHTNCHQICRAVRWTWTERTAR